MRAVVLLVLVLHLVGCVSPVQYWPEQLVLCIDGKFGHCSLIDGAFIR
jgi:hypothetical protein